MNRLLFETTEIDSTGRVTLSGVRAEHVCRVLHGHVGQVLKTGEVNGLIGTSVIEAIECAETADPRVTVRVSHTERAPEPWIDLVLAPPRPRAYKRLLPQLVQMGVGKIYLLGAAKVEKMFWGATILTDEESRPLMIDALMQVGTTALPEIIKARSFRQFMATVPPQYTQRIVAHPNGGKGTGVQPSQERLLLAIGPEGGWTDDELTAFDAAGFARYDLGPRILRTDTAAIALMAQLDLLFHYKKPKGE